MFCGDLSAKEIVYVSTKWQQLAGEYKYINTITTSCVEAQQQMISFHSYYGDVIPRWYNGSDVEGKKKCV